MDIPPTIWSGFIPIRDDEMTKTMLMAAGHGAFVAMIGVYKII